MEWIDKIVVSIVFLALAFGVLYRLKKGLRKETDEEKLYWRKWR